MYLDNALKGGCKTRARFKRLRNLFYCENHIVDLNSHFRSCITTFHNSDYRRTLKFFVVESRTNFDRTAMPSSRSRGTDSGFGEYLEPCKSNAETGVQLVPQSPNIPAQPYADEALADQFKKIRHLVTNHVEIYYKNTKRLEFLPLEPSQLSYFLQRYITAWIVALIQKELKQGT
jgi:hypothetical protein